LLTYYEKWADLKKKNNNNEKKGKKLTHYGLVRRNSRGLQAVYGSPVLITTFNYKS